MINTFELTDTPDPNKKCKNCAYARQRSKFDN